MCPDTCTEILVNTVSIPEMETTEADDNNWLNLEDNHNLESHQHHHYQQQTTILTPTTMPTKKSCFKSATKDMPYLYCQMSGSSTRSGSQRKVRF